METPSFSFTKELHHLRYSLLLQQSSEKKWKHTNKMFNQLQQSNWIESNNAYLPNRTAVINCIKSSQRLTTTLANDQLDAQIFNSFITIFHM
jgi:hypothetical protein